MNRTLVWFLLVGYVPMIVATVLFGLQAIKYSTAWGYFAVGAAILFASFVAAGAWLWCFASIALFLLCLRRASAAQGEENLNATRSGPMPAYFVGYGAFIYVAAQIAKALTAVFYVLIMWNFIDVPRLGFLFGGIERSSAILPSALAAMFAVAVVVQGEAAIPAGSGTGKWYFTAGFWTIVLLVAALLGFAGGAWKWQMPTGVKLDLTIIIIVLVVILVWVWSAVRHLELEILPVTRAPTIPAATITGFAAHTATVPAGTNISVPADPSGVTNVELSWATALANVVQIDGRNVGPQGPLTWHVRGPAGTVATMTMTAIGAGGAAAAQTVKVTLT